MRIALPKASRGFQYSRLFQPEMNDFDVERLLPSLFYLVVTRGRQRGRLVNDAQALDRYVEALARHPRLEGFDTDEEHRLLERWLRTSVVRIGRAGRAKREEQLEYILPLSLLAYKPGFPAEIRRQRNVHVFLYDLLNDALERTGGDTKSEAALSGFFVAAFGQGVHIGDAPAYDGHYDGSTRIDLHTLLSLYFLDGFEPSPASAREARPSHGPALPRVAGDMADALLRYLLAYAGRMPTLDLTRGLMALINAELLAYTVKLQHATNELVRIGTSPALMLDDGAPAGPEIYVDFTGERGAPSDELARACVERDLEELRKFFASSMRLRTLDRFVSLMPDITSWLTDHPTPRYLELLVELQSDTRIQARAQAELEQVRHEALGASQNDTEAAELEAFFAQTLRDSEGDSVKAAVDVLVAAQEKRAAVNFVRWYWSVGGLRKDFGLLSGNLTGRRNWRYAMSDDLLAALVRLAMTRERSTADARVAVREHLRLSEFLEFLRTRYGMLVDEPPVFLDDARARVAAATNLAALKRRLRQMGFFEALSDDFTAQYLRDPIRAEVGA